MVEKHGDKWRTSFRGPDGKAVRRTLSPISKLSEADARKAEAIVKEKLFSEALEGGLVPLARLGFYGKKEPRKVRDRIDSLMKEVEGDVAEQRGSTVLHALVDQRTLKFESIRNDRTGRSGYRLYNSIAKAIIEWCAENGRPIPDITELTKFDLEALFIFIYEGREKRNGEQIKTSTVWVNYIAPLVQAMRVLAVDRDIDLTVPDMEWLKLRLKRRVTGFTLSKAKIGKIVSSEAFAKFAEVAGDKVVLVTLFIALTGVRKTNGVELKWGQIFSDVSGGVFMRAKVKSTIDRATGERTKTIDIVIPPRAAALVESQRGAHDTFVWTTESGHPMRYQNYSNSFFLAQSKMPEELRFRVHDLRHTFVSLVSKVNAETARDAVGHSDIETTRGYIHRDGTFHRVVSDATKDLFAAFSAVA